MKITPSLRILSKSCGCLLGGAIGDALGGPIQLMNLADIRRTLGRDGITGYELSCGPSARITGNTQMTLFTAEGLLRAQVRFELKGIGPAYASVVSHAYLRWLKTQNVKPAGEVALDGWLFRIPELHHSRALATTCISVLKSLRQRGTMARNQARGYEGVVRVAPIGIFGYRALRSESGAEEIFNLGCEIARITHGHPSGFLPAGFLALVIACLMNDQTLMGAIECAIRVLRQQPGHEESLRLISLATRMHGDGTFSPESATAQLGKGWLGHEALALAVLFALFAHDFDEGIQISVNHSGNSAATGSITGNILGALCGLDSIDAHCWLELLELRRVIEHIAVDLVSWPSWDFESDEVWQRYPGH